MIQDFHPFLSTIVVNQNATVIQTDDGLYLELIINDQIIQLIGINEKLPNSVIEQCVFNSKNPRVNSDLMNNIMQHESHLSLRFSKSTIAVLDQYIILSILAAALVPAGAMAVINEQAETALSTRAMLPQNSTIDTLTFLETMPITLFFCGASCYQFKNNDTMVIETTGMDVFGYPDIAIEWPVHAPPDTALLLLHDLIHYYIKSGLPIIVGNTGEYDGQLFQVFAPDPDKDYFLLHKNTQTVLILFFAQ
jgi:hypothetical protein